MTPFDLAQRFVGELHEIKGMQHHPWIQWAHMLCGLGVDQPDEVPWCSSFVNAIAWQLRLPRSKSAAARSWLSVGEVVSSVNFASVGYDVVVLKRGSNQAQGHVGFFAGCDATTVSVLCGNQSDAVSIVRFPLADVLSIRRLS
jgi:uncharacterized protein (TIGR02594 family)